MGLGHVMRMMALAEAARGLVPARFVVVDDPVVPALCLRRGFAVNVLTESSDGSWVEEVAQGDAVVFDGYHFGVDDFRRFHGRGVRVGAVDDYGAGDFPVEVLLNQNPGATLRYKTGPQTKVLAGPKYALVREEFQRRRRVRVGRAETLLVTLGGSDAADLTDHVIAALTQVKAFPHVMLVAGPAAARPDRLGPPADDPRVALVSDPPDVGAAFDQADAALSAAGSTTWELLCMGMPVVLMEIADNQFGNGRAVANERAGIFVADHLQTDRLADAIAGVARPEVRSELSTRALALVDGLGAGRVLAALLG